MPFFNYKNYFFMNKQVVCCYKVVETDKFGTERYFHVRMSYLPHFIKCSVNKGSLITILGRVNVDVFSDFSFHTFKFSERLPF